MHCFKASLFQECLIPMLHNEPHRLTFLIYVFRYRTKLLNSYSYHTWCIFFHLHLNGPCTYNNHHKSDFHRTKQRHRRNYMLDSYKLHNNMKKLLMSTAIANNIILRVCLSRIKKQSLCILQQIVLKMLLNFRQPGIFI